MSDGILVQYVGFKANTLVREYRFQVRQAGEDREFTLNIANAAFIAHLASYQDAPAICAQRLHAELAEHANHPLETDYVITTAELDAYKTSRAEKPRRPWQSSQSK